MPSYVCEVGTGCNTNFHGASYQETRFVSDLSTKVQRKHHADMMRALLTLMGADQEPRVQSHAAAAIVNFCEGASDAEGPNIVGRYLEPLTDQLLVLLRSNNQLVVEGALTATSSIADCSGVRNLQALSLLCQ
jgi:hypothetical protein